MKEEMAAAEVQRPLIYSIQWRWWPLVAAVVSRPAPRPTPPAGRQTKGAVRLDPSLIALDTPQGARLLEQSDARHGYPVLSMHFTTQDNLAYCGVASACMVLNAAGVERPVSETHAPYRLFTQANLFTPEVSKVVSAEVVRRGGMSLQTLGEILRCFPVRVEIVHATDKDLAAFRRAAVEVLESSDNYLLVNYLRKAIKQESGGHISPVAAYHAGEDRFLILDVSRYKYPAVWVKAEALWGAMRTMDNDSARSRGYVIVRPDTK
jgi:hypothetical protein